MPGFVTHYLAGVNAFRLLHNPALKKIIKNNKDAYSLGLQGPDLFFYFLPCSAGIGPNIADIMHKQNTGLFFEKLLETVDSYAGTDEFNTAASYCLGYMGHYLLDTGMHPYVYSQIGTSASNRTLGVHFGLESDIDRILLWHYKHKKPAQFLHSSVIKLTTREKQIISGLLCRAIYAAYNIRLPEWYVRLAMVCFYAETKLLLDPHCRKHRFISFLEQKTAGCNIISPLLINDIKHCHDACNLSHSCWYNPFGPKIIRNDSVFDIFKESTQKYASYMNIMYKALLNHSYDEILNLLGNNSYNSGIDCTIRLKR